jgi:signal transduction histidine kinase
LPLSSAAQSSIGSMARRLSEPSFLELLSSPLPSERMSAARYFASNPVDVEARILLIAVSKETVEPIKRLLRVAAQRINGSSSGLVVRTPAKSENDDQIEGPSAAAIIRHELDPVIGWIRLAATNELGNFESSNLNREIENLQARIDGVISILEAERTPIVLSIVQIPEVVSDVFVNSSQTPLLITCESEADEGTVIESNLPLLRMILGNALTNAVEANDSLNLEERFVSVAYAIEGDKFRIVIVNPTQVRAASGSEFEQSGFSLKADHKGYGMQIIRTAARRLGYTTSLDVTANIATFALRGKVRSDGDR